MKKDLYIYPSVITYADNSILIEFPDIADCSSSAGKDEEVMSKAQEALALSIYEMEKKDLTIPESSKISDIKLENNQCVLLVQIAMPMYREAIMNKAVKKTLTIPKWLNEIAEENKLNFSLILQNAIKQRLGLVEKKEN